MDKGTIPSPKTDGDSTFPDLVPDALENLTEAAPGDSGGDPEPMDDNRVIEETFRQMTQDSSSGSHVRAVNKKVILVSVCTLLLVVLLGTIGFFLISSAVDPYDGLILNNVTVAGVDVGGMSRKDAEAAVIRVSDPLYSSEIMKVLLPDGTLELAPGDVDIRLDVRGAVKAAYAYGRTGSKEQRKEEYEASLLGSHPVDLTPYLKADEGYIQDQLEAYSAAHVNVYSPSSYALEGIMPELGLDKFDETAPCQTLMLTLGTPGGTLDVKAVTQRILGSYAEGSFTLRIEAVDENALPAPLDLKKIHAEFYIEPVNSALDMEEFQVVPGSYGYTFDLALAKELLEQADYGDTVTIPMEYVAPELMNDDLLFQDVLGAYITPHNTNENRNNNLRLACEAINGLILQPGEEFSFNETLGKRTAEKGYKPAPAYSGNELVDSYGGGICQVSSTLYSSTLLADLEILSRVNHGFPPTYMDKGMDATVSWNGPDFQFRNNTRFPIKIQAETTDKEVRIQILGTDDRDYYIKMDFEVVSSGAGVEYEEHAPGGRYQDGDVVRNGSPSFYVKTFRCKYSKETDELISRDYEAASSYQGRPTVLATVREPEPPAPPTEEVLPIDPPPTDGPAVPPAESQTP